MRAPGHLSGRWVRGSALGEGGVATEGVQGVDLQAGRCQRLHQEIVDGARYLIRADAAFLALLGPERRTLRVVAAAGLHGRLWRELEFPVSAPLAGIGLAEGRPFVIASLAETCSGCEHCWAALSEEGLVSALGVPYAVGGRPEGILYAANRHPAGFGERAPDLLEVFVRQAGVAVENARLLGQVEEFTSIVAHDLRAPVTVIQGFAELLRRDAEAHKAAPPVLRCLENIRTATRQLNKMVDDLLDLSRIECNRLRLERRPLDLAIFVPDVVERVAELTRDHPVAVQVQCPLPTVHADPSRIEQVLTNLLSNAAKYSPPGREIAVRVARDEGGAGAAVRVSVADRGTGIPPEEISELFCRFRRASQAQRQGVPGLGLGLYISKGLVEAHGGRIWIESQVGQGSTFSFLLPAGDPS